MGKKFDIVYVISSKLGNIGIGTIALEALRGIERSNLKYKAFSRGYSRKISLNKKHLTNYSFLEYLSYPFRFIKKGLKINIDSTRFVNSCFGYLINKNLPNCKIYHTWIKIAPEAIKKAKKQGAILVLEGANSHPMNYTQIMNKEYRKLGMEDYLINEEKVRKESEIYKMFNYIMCPSDFVYNSFLKQGFSKEKLIKMPYGVNTNKFKPEKKIKKDKKFRAIFVGSIQLRKGIQYLLQAWDELKLKNAELVIVGRVWPDAKKIVEKYKNNKTIKFLSFVDPKEYYRVSDVFVFPTIEEGSALVTYEAIASGLPLITTFNSGSVVRNNKEGFIIPIRDVGSIKEKLIYFHNNPKAIKKMGENARKRVEKYSWNTYGKNLAKIYKKILKHKNGKDKKSL